MSEQLPAPLSVVCRVAGVSRSAACEARRRRGISEPLRRRPGPLGAMSDRELLAEIRDVLATSPFVGEGHRKVWARLRRRGVRTSRKRVLRLTRGAGLLAPTAKGAQARSAAARRHDHRQRPGHPMGDRRHRGSDRRGPLRDGYAQLAPGAQRGRVAATTIEVTIASLADVEHSKRIADRAKERALPRTGRATPRLPTDHQPASEFAIHRAQPGSRLRTPRGAANRESLDRRSAENATRPRAPHGLPPQPQDHRR